MATIREELIAAISVHLIPDFVAAGFVRTPLDASDAAEDEISSAFPLGSLKRRVDHDLHVLEIQFDKRMRSQFVLNAGTIGSEGAHFPWAKIPQEEAPASAAPNAVRVYRNAHLRSWFGPAKFSLKGIDRRISDVIVEVLSLREEVDKYFLEGVVGKHMRSIAVAHP